MPLHSAIFRFRTPHARAILAALQPELADEVNPRSATKAFCEDDGMIVLTVESTDTPALRAALNMALRLVSVAEEMQELAVKDR
jgi:tRNA threonylcarbamoyladenosine modification (KEOPS) complex  Pcc1 subunit